MHVWVQLVLERGKFPATTNDPKDLTHLAQACCLPLQEETRASQTRLPSLRDNSHSTYATCTRLHACANTHWWEIPSKNSTLAVHCEHIPAFFITSRCWNESRIHSCGAVLKIRHTLELAINLPRRRILHVSLYPCKISWMQFTLGMLGSMKEQAE